MNDKSECPVCGKLRSTANMRSHISRIHPETLEPAKDYAEEKSPDQAMTPLQRWRSGPPIFGQGQVGVRIPQHRLKR